LRGTWHSMQINHFFLWKSLQEYKAYVRMAYMVCKSDTTSLNLSPTEDAS